MLASKEEVVKFIADLGIDANPPIKGRQLLLVLPVGQPSFVITKIDNNTFNVNIYDANPATSQN